MPPGPGRPRMRSPQHHRSAVGKANIHGAELEPRRKPQREPREQGNVIEASSLVSGCEVHGFTFRVGSDGERKEHFSAKAGSLPIGWPRRP